MSQVIYNGTADETEPLFDLPDPGDRVRILWNQGHPLGFYSVRPKGKFYFLVCSFLASADKERTRFWMLLVSVRGPLLERR